MANMKFYTREQIKEKSTVTVGNNRTIAYQSKDNVFSCFLHGHEIAQFQPAEGDDRVMKVCLDHCGYMTTTTRNAMHDFMEYFGVDARVSFAKGNFSVKYTAADMRTYTETDAQSPFTFYSKI